MKDRRQHPRALERATILIELLSVPSLKELQGRVYECSTADISAGGIRIAGYAALPVGSEALLLITTSDRDKLQLRGRISWQLQVALPAAFFTGIEFVGLSASAGKRWRAYVDKCLRGNARRLKN